MTGQLIAVVGPSGVGKDTLIEAVAAVSPDIAIVRRVITRPSEMGGEAFDGVSAAEFMRRKSAGHFVLWWEAHGLSYGIPTSVKGSLKAGRTVLFNGSRKMLGDARRAFPDLRVVSVTASRGVLAARLRARGRETQADIEARLDRAARYKPKGPGVIEISNDGKLEDAVAEFLTYIQPVGA